MRAPSRPMITSSNTAITSRIAMVGRDNGELLGALFAEPACGMCVGAVVTAAVGVLAWSFTFGVVGVLPVVTGVVCADCSVPFGRACVVVEPAVVALWEFGA